jgi:hypothetical protein
MPTIIDRNGRRPFRHCERSEAIQPFPWGPRIASSLRSSQRRLEIDEPHYAVLSSGKYGGSRALFDEHRLTEVKRIARSGFL